MARTNQIQVRRGTATQWSNTNPVLASGEPGFDTTNNLLKVGDGTSTWSSLSSNVGVGDAGLLSIAGLTTASGSYLFATANDVYTTGVITAFGRSLVDDADASAGRTTLGLVIGTDVQAYDAGLTSIAGLTTASGNYIYATASDVYTTGVITAFGRSLVDDADASTSRTTLGLVIGTDVQAYDAGLTSIAGLTTASGSYLFATSNDVYTTGISTVYGRSVLAASGINSVLTTALTAGTGIVLSYNSGTDTATINTSGLVIGTNIQAYDAGLLSIAGLTTAADTYIYTSANDVYTTGTITTFGRSLVDDADATTARTTLGLAIGTNVQAYDSTLAGLAALNTVADRLIYATAVDTFSTVTFTTFGRSLIDDVDASTARTTLGLTIGTNVQAYDAGLTSIAGLTTAADRYIYTTANDVYTTGAITTFGRSLVDDADASTARTTLGLGTISTEASGNYALKSSQYIMGILFS